MPFHFCQDELLMLFSAIPMVGFIFKKIHMWYHKHFKNKCHSK